MKNELKELVEKINKKLIKDNVNDVLKIRYISSGDCEIVILEDFESYYFETVVIYEDKARFFGDNYPLEISKKKYMNNLTENFILED